MKRLFSIFLFWCLLLGCFYSTAFAGPVEKIEKKERCPVCGMFVIKFKPWITQMVLSNNDVHMFDGVKDMFAYFFEPQKYGAKPGTEIKQIWVKDYYSQEWTDGKKCFYVSDSDVYGPMGHEFIPFGSIEAAENFKKDHKGKKVLRFDEITLEGVNFKRTGQTMKGNN